MALPQSIVQRIAAALNAHLNGNADPPPFHFALMIWPNVTGSVDVESIHTCSEPEFVAAVQHVIATLPPQPEDPSG